MHEYKFGGLLGKKIAIDENSVFVGKKEIKLERIVTVFRSEPTTFAGGYVYFSLTGEPPKSETSISIHGFKYSKKVEDTVDEFLGILANHGKELEFTIEDAEQGLGSLRIDDVVKSQELQKQKKEDRQRLRCPKCKSANLQHAGNDKKSFSVGKAVGGAVLTGGIGTLAGFAGKKGKKENFVCMNCGKRFTN